MSEKKDCKNCRGTGYIEKRYKEYKDGKEIAKSRYDPCPVCRGSGKTNE